MYRPDGKCKLCDREFETDFNSETAKAYYYGKYITGRVNPCKFVPCLHKIFCLNCAEIEKYIVYHMDTKKTCPLCESSIKKIVYLLPECVYYGHTLIYQWELKNLNYNSQ